MRRASALGNGSECEPMRAFVARLGSFLSQTMTGKTDGFESVGALIVGRCGIVAGPARMLIDAIEPSTSIDGQLSAEVIALAIATPSGPSSTHDALTARSADSMRNGGVPHPASCNATMIASSSATIASQRLRTFCAATNSLIAVSDAAGEASNR